MKQINKISKISKFILFFILIFNLQVYADVSKNTNKGHLLFSSNTDYIGKITLANPYNYVYYIFIGTQYNIAKFVHTSVLEGDLPTRVNYFGRYLNTNITDRVYSEGILRSIVLDRSGVRHIYGHK
jgi:hypothetical protein